MDGTAFPFFQMSTSSKIREKLFDFPTQAKQFACYGAQKIKPCLSTGFIFCAP